MWLPEQAWRRCHWVVEVQSGHRSEVGLVAVESVAIDASIHTAPMAREVLPEGPVRQFARLPGDRSDPPCDLRRDLGEVDVVELNGSFRSWWLAGMSLDHFGGRVEPVDPPLAVRRGAEGFVLVDQVVAEFVGDGPER